MLIPPPPTPPRKGEGTGHHPNAGHAVPEKSELMSDLLLELFSEEIPVWIRKGGGRLRRMVTEGWSPRGWSMKARRRSRRRGGWR